jgi:hypothetical protein
MTGNIKRLGEYFGNRGTTSTLELITQIENSFYGLLVEYLERYVDAEVNEIDEAQITKVCTLLWAVAPTIVRTREMFFRNFGTNQNQNQTGIKNVG